ncbi:MAG TPA: TIGR00730 family Rossman fold protein, partial [Methylomirabilota bacterium]|nr:TIGR00730 family Rossman fold protein [Methylomirabilota bacterium]
GVLNVAGYSDGLLHMLSHAVREGFVRPDYFALLLFADTPEGMLDRFAAWQPPALPRAWLAPSQT